MKSSRVLIVSLFIAGLAAGCGGRSGLQGGANATRGAEGGRAGDGVGADAPPVPDGGRLDRPPISDGGRADLFAPPADRPGDGATGMLVGIGVTPALATAGIGTTVSF